MAVIKIKPTSPGRRGVVKVTRDHLHKGEGYAPLREWIAGHMRGKGVACGIENILITNGSQQGLVIRTMCSQVVHLLPPPVAS